jgi:hypothetical protein
MVTITHGVAKNRVTVSVQKNKRLAVRRKENTTMTTLEQDVKKYTDGLNSVPNAWGQHIIDGKQSHAFLALMYKRHGQDAVMLALDKHYKFFKRA